MPAAVLLDANVLLLLIVGSIDRGLITRFKRTKMFTEDSFDELLTAIEGSDLVTTAHILAEASNHAGQGKRARQIRAVMKSLIVEQLEEPPLTAANVSNHLLFLGLGLTDAGIAMIAAERSLKVITTDYTLRGALDEAQIDTLNIHNLYDFGDNY